ncbi:hypothetical protein [Sorangium sp. So ce204]|uniref:hypothetical protein n=1 Tax=Sorangium sp. So ce204 TaxID=3133288 RepID=UPI003F5F662A
MILSADALAVPTRTTQSDVFEAYVDRLLGWQNVASSRLVTTVISERTAEVLLAAGLYPFGPHLRQMIESCGLEEISVNDILRVANDLLGRGVYIEDDWGISDVSWISVTSVPDLTADCCVPDLRRDIERLLALMTLLGRIAPDVCAASVLIVAQQCSSVAHVTSMIDIVEPKAVNDGRVACFAYPVPMSACVCVGFDVVSAAQHLDNVRLWCAVETVEEADMIIRLAYLKEAFGVDKSVQWTGVPHFRIRQQFLDSCGRYGFMHEPSRVKRLLSALVDLLLSRNESRGHALRTGAGGNDPPRLRGKDRAWRHDVDYEFHLHIWRMESGVIEFACLVTHNDFYIPE